MAKKKDWPHWAYPTKREWKKDVRKRWVKFRKAMDEMRYGSAFYPKDVYEIVKLFKVADTNMKQFYKNV